MKEKLESILKKIIKDRYNILIKDLSLWFPPNKNLWDFAFWCFVLSKELKKSPIDIALELSWYLLEDEDIDRSDPSWPYINISLNKWIYTKQFLSTFKENINCKSNNWEKTIFIDYIWANVWKPLHIGHMCTPNIGQCIINIYRYLGYNVVSDSHIWDWGIIFWKLIKAYKLWWDEKKLKENAVEHLFELYVKATNEAEEDENLDQEYRDEFKRLSGWDKDSVRLWKEFTEYSISSMQIQLNRLNVNSDFNIWESFYEWIWLPKLENYPDLEFDMKTIVSELLSKWIATKNEDNSVWIIFSDDLKLPSCILQKRDWTHWYLASDLSAIKYRVTNWDIYRIIYFADSRQKLHFNQLFEVAKNADWLWDTTLFHAYNWFISLKDWAMSTRKWKIIKLSKLLDEAEERAKKIVLEKRNDLSDDELSEISRIVWIWAIKYWYLKKSRDTDIIFDWDEFMTFEGNSWPYIQYAYVRWIKILEKHWNKDYLDFKSWAEFSKDEEVELVKLLSEFELSLNDTIDKCMPHLLCQYIYNLTKAFSSFYNNVHILSEEDEETKLLRLLLVHRVTERLKLWFELLWIEMPEKM